MATHCFASATDMTRIVESDLRLLRLLLRKKWQQAFCFKDDDLTPIAVGYEEAELRDKLRRLRKLRAKWNPQEKLWLVPYRLIRGTELEARIPEEYLNGSKRL